MTGPASDGPASTGRFADYGRPRRVDGGLRARSTRGAIGRSWWSRRFLEVLESFALGTRLTRGRSYARAGQVLSLDVAPGVVTARVQGSRPEPYQVRIALEPFPAALWERIEAELAAQAFFSARLLAGDLPAELEELCAGAGAPLFPAGVGELAQRCSCPDFAVPCKHLAATFYLLAEAFDADPFELLHWRGRRRAELLDRLRALRAAAAPAADRAAPAGSAAGSPAGGRDAPAGRVPAPAAPSTSDGIGRAGPAAPAVAGVGPGSPSTGDGPGVAPAVGAARSLAALPAAPLDDAVDRFWVPPVPLPDRPPTLSTGPDLLLRQLGAPAPALGGPGLLERLRRAYREFGRARPEPDRPATPGSRPAR
ncbi:SWIM zinc finger family protein [Micromonospora sp. NBC_01655]|uniref:SWIM zinc finger family protein n=1 Tax=Micromonospora sp. NBC_01655 TaxID=2975983 RepID=UPI00225BE70B|nr:SWIM zinc finger family protein [Micromonospora sp. NBC_01655]MCX4470824.1 SWIM zinc finger family protein [Micromonospora sp. NBC_01655]